MLNTAKSQEKKGEKMLEFKKIETMLRKFSHDMCKNFNIDYYSNKELVDQAIAIAAWKTQRDYKPEVSSVSNYGYLKLKGELFRCVTEIKKYSSSSTRFVMEEDITSEKKEKEEKLKEKIEIIQEEVEKKLGKSDWILIQKVLRGDIKRVEAGKIRGCSGAYISQLIEKAKKIAQEIQ